MLLLCHSMGLLAALLASTTHAESSSAWRAEMMDRVEHGVGFFAALDQSGGSTPRALGAYGVPSESYKEGSKSMFDAVHAMRSRIMTSTSFSGQKVLGAILFEGTMDRQVSGLPVGQYLWETKKIVPFIKCDKGLADETDGVQMMKNMPDLDSLLTRANGKRFFGTKMRSVICQANPTGIRAVVQQQFDIARRILTTGLVPIVEPEVQVGAVDKVACEELLRDEILAQLDSLEANERVILKLTIPTLPHFFTVLAEHPQCIRLLALSGGFSRQEAILRLSQQTDMIASFSRALTEGLNYSMTDQEFDKALLASVDAIFNASISKQCD